jgi:hypothetical protein
MMAAEAVSGVEVMVAAEKEWIMGAVLVLVLLLVLLLLLVVAVETFFRF